MIYMKTNFVGQAHEDEGKRLYWAGMFEIGSDHLWSRPHISDRTLSSGRALLLKTH